MCDLHSYIPRSTRGDCFFKMARDTADMQVEQIPSIIKDILLGNNLSRDSDHVFDNVLQRCSSQSCTDIPPIVLTKEDRLILQKDREDAMKCEKLIAKRKQEKYFDLVDQIQNVLQRIEKKNSRKPDSSQNEDVHKSTVENSSDFNNNPFSNHSEVYTENMEPWSPQYFSRDLDGSRQHTQQQHRPGRYSLPANFETMYHSVPLARNFEHSSHIEENHSPRQRPLSAYSLHDVVNNNQGDRFYGGGDGRQLQNNYHTMYSHERPPPVSSHNKHSYSGNNGYHSIPVYEERPYHTNIGKQDEFPPRPVDSSWKTGPSKSKTTPGLPNSDGINHSSMITNSPISQASESHSFISKQRELLALEQVQLENHYAALQGQLLADFQQRQEELIEVYNKSLETQSGTGQTSQSILERSFESDSEVTLTSSTREQEHFTLVRTEELPQSPFGITVKRGVSQNSGQRNDTRSLGNSRAERRKQSPILLQNEGSKSRNNSRSLQKRASPITNSILPDNARFTKESSPFQNQISPDLWLTKSSAASQSQSSRQHDGTRNVPGNLSKDQLSSPASTGKSFNSEVSAQDYYEMPYFRESESVAKGKIGDVDAGNRKGYVGKTSRNSTKNFAVVTSPKRTPLSSFESKTVKNLEITKSRKFYVMSAVAKGFLARLLFQTAKITGLITTIKDAKSVLAEMSSESSQSLTDRSFKERVRTQLHSAQSELRRIFVDSPPSERMKILENHRRLVREKESRNVNKAHSASEAPPQRPKLSNVTMKKRLSRQQTQERTPKSENEATPNSSKASRSASKNTPKSSTRNTPTATKAKSSTKSKTRGGQETPKTSHPDAVSKQVTRTTHPTGATTACDPVATAETAVQRNKTTENKRDDGKMDRNKSSMKSSKTNSRVTQTTKNRRRTWDTTVPKPIQGRISPTRPTEKTRLSNEKRQSTLSTARKAGQKLLGDYQAKDLSGQSSKCEVSGIDMSKTYKVTNTEQAVKKTGARRSLAANLTHKKP
ncbi:uncharacterized protein LOC114519458 isoform X2 [Dendronephthya gigantea]|uniref:uncharacterized protein LOC114519458 isoform X2 n=1 Tax=Dendronephthya gigantea TaxID=151771 RepID=UPI00106C1E09|nr:uncharacterized protein LOC114519458 isoform X2 [Dendronephthya gigantea]